MSSAQKKIFYGRRKIKQSWKKVNPLWKRNKATAVQGTDIDGTYRKTPHR